MIGLPPPVGCGRRLEIGSSPTTITDRPPAIPSAGSVPPRLEAVPVPPERSVGIRQSGPVGPKRSPPSVRPLITTSLEVVIGKEARGRVTGLTATVGQEALGNTTKLPALDAETGKVSEPTPRRDTGQRQIKTSCLNAGVQIRRRSLTPNKLGLDRRPIEARRGPPDAMSRG